MEQWHPHTTNTLPSQGRVLVHLSLWLLSSHFEHRETRPFRVSWLMVIIFTRLLCDQLDAIQEELGEAGLYTVNPLALIPVSFSSAAAAIAHGMLVGNNLAGAVTLPHSALKWPKCHCCPRLCLSFSFPVADKCSSLCSNTCRFPHSWVCVSHMGCIEWLFISLIC